MSFKNNIIKRKNGLPWQVMGDQALVLVPDKQEAHELNETACFIWQQLDGKNSFVDIIKNIQESYDVEELTAEQDLQTSLGEFQSLDLVESL